MKIRCRLFCHTVLSLLLLVILPGCNREARAERKLAAANKHVQNAEYAAAEIEFKNVLELEPGHPDALKGLGFIWVEQGASLDGARILSSASAKFPANDDVALKLALAFFDIGFVGDSRNELFKILDRSPAHGEALMLLAETSLTPDAMAECETRIEASNAADDPKVMLAAALIELRRGQMDAGTRMVDHVLEIDPNSAQALALRATIFRVSKQPEKAEALMKKAAELAGPRSRETGSYAGLLMELKRRDDAVSLLKQAVDHSPDYLPNWRLLGKIALSDQNDAEATEYLSKVLAKSPLDIEAGLLMSQIWIRAQEPTKAVQLLEEMTRAIPSRPVIELGLAKAYLANGDARKATETLDRVLAVVPGASEAILLRTDLHLKDGEPAEAIRIIEPMLAADPSNRMAQNLLIQAYSSDQRTDDAVNLLKQQAEAAPNDSAPLLKLGILLRSQKKLAEAREAFESIIKSDPDHLGAISQLAELDHQEGHADAAMRRADDYLSRHPDSPEGHLLKAGLSFSRQDFKTAESSLEKVIALKPDSAVAYGILVSVMVNSGRAEEAVARLNQLLENSKGDEAWARMELGELLLKLGHNEDARDCFEKLIELQPDHAAAHNNLAYIYSEVLVDPDKALASARKARSLDPRNPSISDTLGWIEWQRENYAEALPLLEEAAAGLPDLPTAHYHLAMARYMMGASDKAAAGLEKALSMNAPFPEKATAEQRLASLRSGEGELTMIEQRARENPDDVIILLQLARALAQAGRFDDALAAYDKALAVNPDLEAAYLGRSHIYAHELKDPAKALEAASQARRIAPSSRQAQTALGIAHLLNGNHEEAYGLLKDASSGNPSLLPDLAWSAYSLGRVDEARSAMNQAISGGTPREKEAVEFLALTAPDRLQNPETRAIAESAIARNPDHVPALMVLAGIQDQDGRDPEKNYLRILAIYPKFDLARKALALHYLRDPKKTDEAETLALEARKRLRDDPDLTGILAIISYRKSKFDYASQLLKELATERPLTAQEHFALGMSQAATKNADAARHALAKALELGLPEAEIEQARATLESLDAKKVEE